MNENRVSKSSKAHGLLRRGVLLACPVAGRLTFSATSEACATQVQQVTSARWHRLEPVRTFSAASANRPSCGGHQPPRSFTSCPTGFDKLTGAGSYAPCSHKL